MQTSFRCVKPKIQEQPEQNQSHRRKLGAFFVGITWILEAGSLRAAVPFMEVKGACIHDCKVRTLESGQQHSSSVIHRSDSE
eukprot:3496998-Amphidinium_carterae.1